jgi:hypothetical protein
MKRLIMAMLVFTIGVGLYAQNNFFPSKVGMVLTYANNDARGNAESYSVLTIKEVKGSGRNMTVTYGANALDKDRKQSKDLPTEQIFQVTIKDNVAIMDMKQLFPTGQGVKVEVTGTALELPSDLRVGQALKDSVVTGTMDLGIMKMSTVIKMTEGKCLAIEDVRVPAGTFKCHKITQKITSTAMGVNNVGTTISWYAPNIGTVKTESYDDKNKLISGTVLVELKGN